MNIELAYMLGILSGATYIYILFIAARILEVYER